MSAPEQMTGEEMFESLTGFEEIAIGNHFGTEVSDLADSKPTMFLRALVFTAKTREGKTAKDAKQAAMEMSLKACHGFFAEKPDEVMDDEPVTPEGKPAKPVTA